MTTIEPHRRLLAPSFLSPIHKVHNLSSHELLSTQPSVVVTWLCYFMWVLCCPSHPRQILQIKSTQSPSVASLVISDLMLSGSYLEWMAVNNVRQCLLTIRPGTRGSMTAPIFFLLLSRAALEYVVLRYTLAKEAEDRPTVSTCNAKKEPRALVQSNKRRTSKIIHLKNIVVKENFHLLYAFVCRSFALCNSELKTNPRSRIRDFGAKLWHAESFCLMQRNYNLRHYNSAILQDRAWSSSSGERISILFILIIKLVRVTSCLSLAVETVNFGAMDRFIMRPQKLYFYFLQPAAISTTSN